MEIRLNAGDQIQIPTGYKAVIKDGMITIEEEKTGFKDGDILSVSLLNGKTVPFIYKCTDEAGFYKFYTGIDCFGEVVRSTEDSRWGHDTCIYATEEEKQRLFNKLKEQGLYWDAATKQLKRIKVRVGVRCKYLYIDSTGLVQETIDCRSVISDRHYASGNYYLLGERELAEKDAAEIRKVYKGRFKI